MRQRWRARWREEGREWEMEFESVRSMGIARIDFLLQCVFNDLAIPGAFELEEVGNGEASGPGKRAEGSAFNTHVKHAAR